VIHVTCNYRSIEKCYWNDSEQYKLKGGKVKRFNEKILDKIFYEWWDILPKEKRPKIINIDTSFI
jgi:GTPase SAR1 family protein